MIRALNLNEIEFLAAIDMRVNPSHWKHSSYLDAFNSPNQYIIGIFTDNNQLAGGLVYSKVLDEAEILQICIDTQFQKQGLAQKLFDYLLNTLIKQNIQQVFLEVRQNNHAAINLYHKAGFNIIAERKDYYRIHGKTYNALIMAKTL